ncbi:MAG: hypothetical protein GEU88_18170 [Solirubrobacterales bacterium]|nr:hypothetical protein [Solirubrobacterales bacterium]
MIAPSEAPTAPGGAPTGRPPWEWSASWLDSRWVTALFGLAVAILTWDGALVTPIPGLDPSWILGLNLAAAAGLDHGTQFVFTYGPLGFLEEPLVVDGGLATLSALYLLASRAALAASLLWVARRSFGWLPAAALAVVVAAIAPRAIGSVPLALTMVWCLVALQAPAPRWAPRLVVVGGGALAALEVLVKLNVGLTILAVVVVTAVALPGDRVRRALGLLGVFVFTYAALWFASGQGIGNVDDYIRSSFYVVSGYSEAMQHEAPVVAWDWLAALLVGLVTLGATAVAAARGTAIRGAAMVLIVGLLLFSLEKFAFVRHDGGSVAAFFEGLLPVWLALRWRGVARLVPWAAVALISLAYFTAAKGVADFTIQPKLAVDQLRTLLVPDDRAQARDDARAAMRAAYAVDPRSIRRIGDAPVDARPWEIGLIWAYDLNWRPLAVIQDYQAYTPELDRLNADALASDDGPRFILRHAGYGDDPRIGVDGRFTTFDAPRETQVMLCRFRPALTSGSYQLLVRARDRCGEPRPLGTVTAAYGEQVAVPAAGGGEAVFARIDGAAAHGIERLRAFAYRAAVRRISLGPASAPLPARNAESGLLISAPPDADFPAPFALAPNVETIAVDSEGGFATSEGELRIEFYAMPIRSGG